MSFIRIIFKNNSFPKVVENPKVTEFCLRIKRHKLVPMFDDLEKVLRRVEVGLKDISNQLEILEKKVGLLEGKTKSIKDTEDDEIELMSRKDVSKVLCVHIDTVSKYIQQKRLEHIKVGRRVLIEKKSLKNFIENNKMNE